MHTFDVLKCIVCKQEKLLFETSYSRCKNGIRRMKQRNYHTHACKKPQREYKFFLRLGCVCLWMVF